MVTDPIKFVYKVGDGVTTDFSYAYNGTVGFDADVAEDVRAAILNPDGTRDTNPNFAVLKDTYGNFTGAIRFATAPVANAVVYIYRATPQTQETEYKTSSGFDAKNVENDFDKLTKLVQETSSHARNKTVQLDMFQENVLKFILASEANQNQMLFFDFSTLTFRFTSFTKGQAVISSASASDDKTDIMLTHLTDEGTGLPYLAFSLDQGATWKPMNFAEISAIVNSANAKAQEALDNSETAVSVAAAAKAVADGIDAKAQEALDNSETAVSVAAAAKAVADGIDAKAQEALDNSETAVSTANDAKAVADGVGVKINEVQGDVDTLNAKVPSNASASNKMATAAEISNLQNQIDTSALEIKGLQGAGGALTATNLGPNPTQQAITEYAIDQIWPNNTNFTWNAANPAASTFTDANGVARTAAEIFNSTWVNNTYDDHRWQLTNTQNTAPKVFEWADVGRDIVSVATATTAGIVRVGSGSQMVVNASTGDISLDGTKASSIRSTIGALASNQGSSNSGLILGIDGSGNVVPTESSSGGRNIGDIFWTTRTDSALNGAVEANGAQYNFADVNQGQNNVQALLVSGALPSVTIAEFDTKVASDGGCDSFGYDSSATYFKVPKKTPRILVRCQKPTADNNHTWYNLYADGWVEQGGFGSGADSRNIYVSLPIEMSDVNYTPIITTIRNANPNTGDGQNSVRTISTTGFVATSGVADSATISWQVSGYAAPAEYTKDKWDYQNVQVERPMVQLFNSATDEAVATCTSVLQDVANLNMGDYVIYWDSGDATDHSHAKPGVATPASGTWYRLYKSGWVEQGGGVGNPNGQCLLLTLPIAMKDNSFTAVVSGNTSGIAANYNGITCDRRSSTQIAICTTGQQGNGCSWRVDGYAA